MPLQRVLITGSSGLLGRELAARFAKERRTVVGLDIRSSGGIAGVEEVVGDVSDPHLLYRLFAANRFEGVVHCGGISGQMVAPNDPYLNCSVNVFGTMQLLEVARVNGVRRFVYSSSQGAYGTTSAKVIVEDTPMLPVTVYGATKAACDVLIRAYRVQHKLDAVSLRIGRVYGPGRRTGSLITTIVDAALQGQSLCLPASGGRRLQYVYEADIVSALALALDAPSLGQCSYNVSGPGSHSDEDIANLVKQLVPGADIAFNAVPLDDGSFLSAPLDYSAASRDFGYSPAFSLERGIGDFIERRKRC